MGIFSELKRRKVYNVAGMYAAAAFVVWQAADILVPSLSLPGWTMKAVVILTALGFPVALVLAWVYDITPTPASDQGAADEPATSPGWRRATIAALAILLFIGAGFWAVAYRVRPKA